MQINSVSTNNGTSQSFTALKSIKMNKYYNVDRHPKVQGLIKAFNESEAITNLCSKYDVNAIFKKKKYNSFDKAGHKLSFRTSMLTLKVKDKSQSLLNRIFKPDKKITLETGFYGVGEENDTIKRLTAQIKELKPNDLTDKLKK